MSDNTEQTLVEYTEQTLVEYQIVIDGVTIDTGSADNLYDLVENLKNSADDIASGQYSDDLPSDWESKVE